MRPGIPGLSDALTKLDETSAQMANVVSGISRLIELIEEQNELLKGRDI